MGNYYLEFQDLTSLMAAALIGYVSVLAMWALFLNVLMLMIHFQMGLKLHIPGFRFQYYCFFLITVGYIGVLSFNSGLEFLETTALAMSARPKPIGPIA